MKAIVYDWYTDIYLTGEEVKQLCRPGQGTDTCSWLLVGVNGFECSYLHKPHVLMERRDKKQMVAMRDGCERVKRFNPFGIDGETQVPEIPEADRCHNAEKSNPGLFQ